MIYKYLLFQRHTRHVPRSL